MDKTAKIAKSFSRRQFLATSAAATAGAVLASNFSANLAFGAGSDKIRIGLIGCGGRGVGAVHNCVASSPGIVVKALGDVSKNQVKQAFASLKGLDKPAAGQDPKDRIFQVDEEHCFAGLDAYKKVIASDVDLVLLCTPPGFRPMHFQACIEAGKHVFAEKPVAVDPVGIRQFIETAKLAKEKNLAVVAGTVRRRQPNMLEIVKRIHDGQIGDVVGGQIYYLTGPVWCRPQGDPGMSEIEWQCFDWYYWDWLSGDHIVEQHVHEIDSLSWIMNGPPEKIMAMGGRASRPMTREQGNIYDHFAVEFEYPNGVRIISLCRQTNNTAHRVNLNIVGTKGKADCYGGHITGETNFTSTQPGLSDAVYTKEHTDLVKSIRDGKPLNEAEQVAIGSLMAIGGRMSAYTGREFSWSWLLKQSKLEIFPKDIKPGPGIFTPIAVPGTTQLI